jgi:sodium/potassium-transporting ATPase subunit alpha
VTSGGLFSNKLVLVGIATELTLILLIDYTPWGNMLFGTAPISARAWLFVVPFALGMVLMGNTQMAHALAPKEAFRGCPLKS